MATEQGQRSWKARNKLERTKRCGCYYCISIYFSTEIKEWVDSEKTAICPKCGIDSVVPFDKKVDRTLEEFAEKLRKWKKESFE